MFHNNTFTYFNSAQALLESMSHFVLKFGQFTIIGKRSFNDHLLPMSPSRGEPRYKKDRGACSTF